MQKSSKIDGNWLSMNFVNRLRKLIKSDIFTDNDVYQIFREKTGVACNSAIQRALANKSLIKLKRGIYCFSRDFERVGINPFIAGNYIYNPSYISFESSLSYHSLIPEGVYEITSACYQQKSKKFTNTLGVFTYKFVPHEVFWLDMIRIDSANGSFLISTPLKALLDLLYSRRIFFNSICDLEENLRIETEDLKKIINAYSAKDIMVLSERYEKRNISSFGNLLIKEFK